MVDQTQKKRKTNIFNLASNVYAFDSTSIDLYLVVFWWTKFRKKKGGIKIHTLYNVETHIPAFFHITTALVHDSKTMNEIPYEIEAYYIFDRGYNCFRNLFWIETLESYFIVRAKSNLQFKAIKWKRRLPQNILSDASGELMTYKSSKDYPSHIRKVCFGSEEQKHKFTFFTNVMDLSPLPIAELYKNKWQIKFFFKWLEQHLKIKKF